MMDTGQCKGCYFWRYLHESSISTSTPKCCHYLLITGERRKRDGDKCLSRKPRRRGK